jgi:Na+-driven multidrug efflux pump
MNTARQDLRTASMQLLRHRLLSGGSWAFGGKMLVALTGLISSALLARLLTPQALGTYFLAYSILSVGTALADLGLARSVVRLVAEGMGLSHFGRVRCVIGVVLGVGTLGALGVGLAYLLFGDDLAKAVFNAPALAAITGLVAGWIMVVTLQGLVGETFRGFHDVRLAKPYADLRRRIVKPLPEHMFSISRFSVASRVCPAPARRPGPPWMLPIVSISAHKPSHQHP